MRHNYTLMLVTDERTFADRPIEDVVALALRGGATMVQLRHKLLPARELVALGRALHAITRAAGVPLVVNDRVDVALAIGAEGAHVGQGDMPARDARALLGPQAILGVSTATLDEAWAARADGASYLGVGDIFGTASKDDAGAPVGLARLRQIAAAVGLPVVAIGGITVANAPQVAAAGAAGAAVISAIVGVPDPEVAARLLRRAFEHELSQTIGKE
ncbi:thiamine phosphate synthase [Chloroflexia bacterium SDU3-3]|nr:thiamine phosphate synthase [Chloroflexia bacterium SDU3-3]